MCRLGIVGHCFLGARATAFVNAESRAFLARRLLISDDVVALSALAVGADTLFAEAAMSAEVPLEIVRPYDGYDDEFLTRCSRTRYDALLTAARRETRLPFGSRSPSAYEAAMKWIVEASDVLVAAWDGAPRGIRGGTAHAVSHAERIGREVVHLHVVTHRVRVRLGQAA